MWRWGVVVGREWNKGEGVEVEDVIGERGADKSAADSSSTEELLF